MGDGETSRAEGDRDLRSQTAAKKQRNGTTAGTQWTTPPPLPAAAPTWLLRLWISTTLKPMPCGCARPNSAAMKPVCRAVGKNTMTLDAGFVRIVCASTRASVGATECDGATRNSCLTCAVPRGEWDARGCW